MLFKPAVLLLAPLFGLWASAADYYLSINDASNTPVFPASGKTIAAISHAILIQDFTFDVKAAPAIATGAGAGKLTFNSLVIHRVAGPQSSILFKYLTSGQPLKNLTIDLLSSSATTGNFVSEAYIFNVIAVSDITYNGAAGATNVIETISFQYGSVEVDSRTINTDGTPGQLTQNGWNLVKNNACVGSACVSST